MSDNETRYADIQRVIQNVLDRDGQHDWDETSRLTEVIAPAVWNEIHTFPLAAERSAGAAPDVDVLAEAIAAVAVMADHRQGTHVHSIDDANSIAAEYARLFDAAPPQEPQP